MILIRSRSSGAVAGAPRRPRSFTAAAPTRLLSCSRATISHVTISVRLMLSGKTCGSDRDGIGLAVAPDPAMQTASGIQAHIHRSSLRFLNCTKKQHIVKQPWHEPRHDLQQPWLQSGLILSVRRALRLTLADIAPGGRPPHLARTGAARPRQVPRAAILPTCQHVSASDSCFESSSTHDG